ncbi:MAG: decarboxylating NADP(+)-dependent phosphogluconate dehydrogenase [Eubacteriales bacterium]|jgi:6-phosphogluconate dehydrogenase|nr:decarboxylating NADP(+)-dependent phosphogluconate dehydrogenase [Eubacteriales bacterium]MDD4105603.1 decarboxylating NADP(+)-dependent phosphogluconate dehydrogenase [Eubacteriales bacterium]MDD4710869.1 decarboxylating NADP(+)-dependent phosphogluconate dehydrogenase [Eubacteriales bacterium]NLO14894.1 decarboxylating NADP(+)-dependent phosphogluconate dehydrogenase [Clostridiales bacterium]
MNKADIGLIGLAVMGENLVMNMESKGFTVAVFNRTTQRVTDFIKSRAKGKNIIGTYSLEELVSALSLPRKVMLMVKAGQPVDDFIEALLPLLSKGDIIIDGGNSHFPDTARRTKYVESKGLYYIGTGVSGGEEGALKGPSIMPGGSPEAWPHVKPILQGIAAKVDGQPCCDWVGEDGAGHFVKMVHNGIEYGDMQLICEAYLLMRDMLHMSAPEIAQVFSSWNEGELDSYLIEITADILKTKDEDGLPLVDKILDTAGQKGTGKWTATAALDQGVPLTLIGEAVFARYLSADKDGRVKASQKLKNKGVQFTGDKELFVESIRRALYAAKIISYTQGYLLMASAAKEYGWNLNFGGIALMWRGGCIIRSAFLGKITDAFKEEPNLENLLFAPYFGQAVEEALPGWRSVCAEALNQGIPLPAMTSALSYYDGLRLARGSANLLQAQRDYFGAHTYERVDHERGEFFHTNWTGKGGDTSSSTYNA